MRFAETIGCKLDPKAKYPLANAFFLEKLAAWTSQLNRENAKRMADVRPGRRLD